MSVSSAHKTMSDAPIDHVAIAVDDLEEATRVYSEVLGFTVAYRETIADQGVDVVGLRSGDGYIELVQAKTGNSAVGRLAHGAGPKAHHVAIRVDDVAAELERLKKAGMRAVDEKPRRGAQGTLVALLHPASTEGVMIELCQRP